MKVETILKLFDKIKQKKPSLTTMEILKIIEIKMVAKANGR